MLRDVVPQLYFLTLFISEYLDKNVGKKRETSNIIKIGDIQEEFTSRFFYLFQTLKKKIISQRIISKKKQTDIIYMIFFKN